MSKGLPLLGMDDQHRRDLVVEEDTWDSSRSVGGGVTLSVFGSLVVRGEVSFVGGYGVLLGVIRGGGGENEDGRDRRERKREEDGD